MKKIFNHTALLILSIFITLFVAVIYVYINYAASHSTSQAVAASDLTRTEQANKNNQQNVIDLYNSTKEMRAKLPDFFIKADKGVEFIESIESLGGKAGGKVTINSIGSDKLENSPAGTLGLIKANVNVRGSWSSVVKTLSLAENLPYKSAVNNVKLISSPPNGPKEWDMTFDLIATIVVPFK